MTSNLQGVRSYIKSRLLKNEVRVLGNLEPRVLLILPKFKLFENLCKLCHQKPTIRRHVLRVYTSVYALHQHLFHISHNEVLYFIGLRRRRMCDWKNFIVAHALSDHLYINPKKSQFSCSYKIFYLGSWLETGTVNKVDQFLLNLTVDLRLV